jgi:hypothetical protein
MNRAFPSARFIKEWSFIMMYRLCVLLTIVAGGVVAATEDGILTVKTDPEGIEVWLDDKYVGDSPIVDKKLKPGRYNLKLIDQIRHSSTSEDVFIQPAQTTVVEKTVVGKFGSLKVNTQPDGAEVSISTALGKTPLSNDFMTPGKYRLEIKHPGNGYVPAVEEIVIPKGKAVELNKTLQKKNALDTKALARLALGAGAVGGYVWGAVQNGRFHGTFTPAARSSAQVQRTLGIVLGSVCVVGFEIVAFF